MYRYMYITTCTNIYIIKPSFFFLYSIFYFIPINLSSTNINSTNILFPVKNNQYNLKNNKQISKKSYVKIKNLIHKRKLDQKDCKIDGCEKFLVPPP